eukprot:scaffold263509_cov41-Attheya_sp.AAC.1
MPRSSKGVGHSHKSGTGNNKDKPGSTPYDVHHFKKQQSTQLRSPLIAVPPLEDSVIHPQLPSTQQSPSVSFSRTTPQPNTGAMPTRVNGTTPTSHHRDTSVEPPLHNRESHNNYGGIVDVNRLSQSQREQLDTMIIQQYLALCNTNEDSSTFVSPPPIPTIESLSQSTVSSLGTRGSRSSTSSGTTSSSRLHSESSFRTNSSCTRASRRN